MDFFQSQADAHRNTRRLVVMFVLAVIGIVLTTMVVTAIAVGAMQQHTGVRQGRFAPQPFPWQVPVGAGVAALGLIGGGSLFKIAQLSGGGTVVAERLGGVRVYPNTTDPVERRLLNVIEEMALASGVPVPAVFILNREGGINAFAAGHTPSDAVVAVTRGCAQQLTRDQLQGVVAHEFSHILNGDMRLDLRLMGVLYGILIMGLLGREVLRMVAYGGGRSSRSNRDNGVPFLLVIGLTFMVLGFLGSLFGNLIKAAVSRQREFLADASAVQFTRNPDGIAGALKRIGSAIFGSKLQSPRAAEASHMYFAEGVSSLFATHPPLSERIHRIDPQWDGTYPPQLPADAVVGLEAEGTEGFMELPAAAEAAAYDKPVPARTIHHAARQVANPTDIHRKYVQQLLAAIPQPLLDAAHEPYGARALVFALLLDDNADVRAAQLAALQKAADANVFELTLQLVKPVNQLDVRAALPLMDMALPALRALSPSQYNEFSKCFLQLAEADQRISLFEWTLHHILLRHLRPQFEAERSPQIVYYGLQQLERQCSLLLSAIARVSQRGDESAFAAGAKQIPETKLQLLSSESCKLSELDQALRDLAQVAPKQRERLVDACAACICADSEANVEECELLRAICDTLDCPMPPLVAGQEVSPSLIAEPAASRVS
ncbi:MAG TPA: M48 family metallopeptidase [Lacipirellulaceae bacterium]|nr:M48 family metallopeptidase [Lacipirellulaceae bacterium]